MKCFERRILPRVVRLLFRAGLARQELSRQKLDLGRGAW